MKTTLTTLFLFLAFNAVAQLLYQGPTPQTLFTAPQEQTFLNEFNEKFKGDFDATAQYAKAQTTGVDSWEMALFTARQAQTQFYKNYPQTVPFSESFKRYIESCIRWHYWHLLLAYPIVRGNAQTAQLTLGALPAVMLDAFDETSVNDEGALPAEPYRDFLLYYVTYFNSKARQFAKYTQNDVGKSLSDKAAFGRQHLTGGPYQYTLARLLVENCDKATPSSVREGINTLTNTANSAAYVAQVKAHCGDVLARKDDPKPAEAKPKKQKEIAPNVFSFTNANGEPVTLDEYKGKVIYLDIWASWCGPCRAEFPFSKQLHERLDKKLNEKVVFLFLSIDDSEEAWKAAARSLQLPGEQGWSKGGWRSRVVQYFGVQSIPRYILIDKKGGVVDLNAKRPSTQEAIWQDILKLAEQ